MTQIGGILLIFGLVRLLISCINWLSHSRLPACTAHSGSPSVSVLITARDEEKNIGLLLNDLIEVEYRPIEIIVYDDQSADRTAEIVKDYAKRYEVIRYIPGRPLEKGWLGKNFACYQLAGASKGDKLLFLDADVRVNKYIIEKSLAYMERYRLKLLSIFPAQVMPSLGSRIAVPLMNWILLTLLPLSLVRLSHFRSLSAANGQFMFFDGDDYRKIKPHRLCRKNQVEDIAIAEEYKRRKKKIAVLLGNGDISCRMYENLQDSISGFSKNVFRFFGNSKFLTLLFLFVTTITPVYLFIFNGSLFGLLYIGFIIAARIIVSRISNQPVTGNLLLLIPQQLVFWRIVISAFTHIRNKNLTWKGRNIFSS